MQTPEQIIAEAKRWRAIYPSYIDSTLSCSEGRRLGKSRCVECPQLLEISDALRKLGLQHVVEGHKIYSRDIFKNGRIKVKILNDDKVALNPTIKNKHNLLQNLAQLIKSIPNRKIVHPKDYQPIEQEQQQQPIKKSKQKK